jgi:hypothetical protein
VCSVEVPALRPVIGPGHLSACHFAEDFAAVPVGEGSEALTS